MPDAPTLLRALIARLLTEEPSRELDLTIAEALPGGIEAGRTLRSFEARNGRLPHDDVGTVWVRHYTSSIDAKLPGEDDGRWVIEGPGPMGGWRVDFSRPFEDSKHFVATAPTEAMARRAAFLKWMLAEKEARDDG